MKLTYIVLFEFRESCFEKFSGYMRHLDLYSYSPMTLAAWSSGMILVSGAGGHGFNSRSSPYF